MAAAATPVTSDSYEEALEARRREWEGVTVKGPADFETQQAVRDTMWQILACVNADMFVHLHSLYSDDLIRQNQPTLEELRGDDPTWLLDSAAL